MTPSVQVVIVNYRVTGLLLECVASLLAAPVPGLDVTVVDNSCDPDERARLAALPAGVRLVVADDNLGFARACNLGARLGRGTHLLFLNPDTLVPPGSLAALVAALERHGDHALIGPRQFADADRAFAHAPMRGIRLLDEVHDLWFARGWDPRRPLRYLAARARLAGRRGPVSVRCLSGGCLGTSRALFERLGGWDEGYWLYGEDVELCARARRRGCGVLWFPEIGIVHLMERSARLLAARARAAQRGGRERFKRQRYGPLAGAERWLHRRVERWLPARADPWREPAELAELAGVPLAAPAGAARWAIELARSPLFDNCLSAFPSRPRAALPADLIAGLPAGEYFVQVAGQHGGRWSRSALYRFTSAGAVCGAGAGR